MEEELLRRIFEPFFTAKRESGGNGLGLSIVYGIVEQAGGRIEVRSVPSVGTSFDIYLPQCAAPEEMPPTGSPAAALLLPEAAPLVLVVDDEDGVLRFTSRFLAKHGLEVLTASNGEEAMHLLERYSDPLDLLLTDVMMPVIGGRELGRWVAGFLPDLPGHLYVRVRGELRRITNFRR